MRAGLTSIVIPTYNHAQFVGDAVDCALAQTAPVEVIVVDDGSTDATSDVLARYGDHRLIVLREEHAGVCAARNRGIEVAQGEFLQFLDADDLIAPYKIAHQLARFRPDIGWVICDGMIEDEATGRTESISQKYDYRKKKPGGWIQELLAPANFIPTFSPLIRRSVVADNIRFTNEHGPEDWHFWHAVAGVARVAYLAEVLGTYRHRRTGRSRLPRAKGKGWPTLVDPLRLNLGCGPAHLPGMVNLDAEMGWRFENGLGEFIEGSVAGITVSHALMYVPIQHWPGVFAEFARVLRFGGVVRLTEDSTADPRSSRFGGWKGSQPAVTLCTPQLLREHLQHVGLTVHDVSAQTTRYADRSLCQQLHGKEPDVFFIEGVRDSTALFAPHADDETLFAAFTILRHRPRVVICCPSAGDYGDTALRETETREALSVMGGTFAGRWDGSDLVARMRAFDAKHHPARVWAPDRQCSHPDHRAVADAATEVFAGRLTTYHTYDERGRVRSDRQVDVEPAWIETKLRALLRYPSQLRHPRASRFWLDDQREYYGVDQ